MLCMSYERKHIDPVSLEACAQPANMQTHANTTGCAMCFARSTFGAGPNQRTSRILCEFNHILFVVQVPDR
jgi:hypothetical protein